MFRPRPNRARVYIQPFFLCKGAFKYYVIRLGGVGGLNQNDDNDDAFRGGGGVWDLDDDMMTNIIRCLLQ